MNKCFDSIEQVGHCLLVLDVFMYEFKKPVIKSIHQYQPVCMKCIPSLDKRKDANLRLTPRESFSCGPTLIIVSVLGGKITPNRGQTPESDDA